MSYIYLGAAVQLLLILSALRVTAVQALQATQSKQTSDALRRARARRASTARGNFVDLVSARQSVTDGQPAAAYVVSRQVAGSNLAREVGDALDGFPVLQARTSQRVAYAEALSSGGAVVLGPDKKAAAEIDALTDEILTLLSPSS